jgi:hypothetical protein
MFWLSITRRRRRRKTESCARPAIYPREVGQRLPIPPRPGCLGVTGIIVPMRSVCRDSYAEVGRQMVYSIGGTGFQPVGTASAQARSRRPIMLTTVMLRTSSSLWFIASTRPRTMPRSALEREGRASRIVTRILTESPGRNGFGHRRSSTPGEARLATCER